MYSQTFNDSDFPATDPVCAAARKVFAKEGRVRQEERKAHDLRNSLCLVVSLALLLRDGLAGPVTPHQKEFLRDILDCAGRAQAVLVPSR